MFKNLFKKKTDDDDGEDLRKQVRESREQIVKNIEKSDDGRLLAKRMLRELARE